MSGASEPGASASGAPPATGTLIELVATLTGLFPFWVLGAGALGFMKPAALGWLKGELVTFSLALTMLFMGMTLTVKDFDRVLTNPKQVFLGSGFVCGVCVSVRQRESGSKRKCVRTRMCACACARACACVCVGGGGVKVRVGVGD